MEKLGILKRAFTALVFCAGAIIASRAQTLTVLLDFNSTTGGSPYSSLVQGSNGNLYGTLTGALYCYGTAFEMTTAGALIAVYDLCSPSYGSLARGPDGNLYGTMFEGGDSKQCTDGCGAVFKITPGGTVTVIYNFGSQPYIADGALPYAGLVRGKDGDFYGTTWAGGPAASGTVFKITPEGNLTTLYGFCPPAGEGCPNGAEPYASLVQAKNGNFYGTTAAAGAGANCVSTDGCGTVFEITPAGEFTTLYNFCSQPSCTDGSYPYSSLVEGADGNLYGTTSKGGESGCLEAGFNGCGTVFEITPAGKLTTLYNLGSQPTDGIYPYDGLVRANGKFYGTTYEGGTLNGGTIFEITKTGKLTALYNFCYQCATGSFPYAGLVRAANGNFYGETSSTVFSFSVEGPH